MEAHYCVFFPIIWCHSFFSGNIALQIVAVEAHGRQSVTKEKTPTVLKLTLKFTAPWIKLEAMGAMIRIYKKLLISLSSAITPDHTTTQRRKCLSSQPAKCINNLRSFYWSARRGFRRPRFARACTPVAKNLTGLISRLFVGKGDDVVVDALLLQLLQLFGCSFSVHRLALHHGCVRYRCESKEWSIRPICRSLVTMMVISLFTLRV